MFTLLSPMMTSMHLLAGQALLLTSLIAGALAHDNGMNMNMDQGMSMNMGNMIMYLHFKIGDNLWFYGWAPGTAGAMAGACIGLFMLAMAERWLVAMRGVMEEHWSMRAQIALSNKLNKTSTVAASTPSEERTNPSLSDAAQSRLWHHAQTPPFIFAHDIPRGILQIVIASINFLLMLTVMTFQVGFIFTIVVGLGIGEALFGRYSLQIGDPH
ncbi:Ctr copper transporter family-domain-containing protein [Russula aff. rugulosa BPL654]|nr:Ctr copper transporter family-domain-containing protein [Russula aff. rugulosa BPL654]